ncbi:MAG: 1-acyl-sn-glycerol-3-phosphate acyltransferase [Flavobacteriia bacterium]|nr:1-acyl-sn-glycerol-3-phosphate acyltransferase [Flavobacteriia bacterium]
MSRFFQQSLTNSIKSIVRAGLWCYFKEVRIQGFSKEAHGKSVIYMANHQNALLDALLIAAHTHRKTTFITRSDVFKNPLIGAFLKYIGMLPIYRFRDGVDTLKKNQPIFEQCGSILDQQESILIFPEGNHGFQRKLRPLKKGFLQLLSERWKLGTAPVYMYPIGLNYQELTQFPDRVSVIFGSPFALGHESVRIEAAETLIARVAASLQELTTHIPLESEEAYKNCELHLKRSGFDFLDPLAANVLIKEFISQQQKDQITTDIVGNRTSSDATSKTAGSSLDSFFKSFFTLVNFLPIFIWHRLIKPEIAQKEFISTLRFAFCMVFYPFFFLFLSLGVAVFTKNIGAAVAAPMVLFAFNLLSVKKLL